LKKLKEFEQEEKTSEYPIHTNHLLTFE